ncbi:MAG: response regulator [Bdellovibrionales bacterium]|nr:response regulator [Bdellovibrionales bacterium]
MHKVLRNVCIVDDDKVCTHLYSRHFEKWGYIVESFNDSHLAHERLLKADFPLLVILDWMMPGLDGIEIIKSIKAKPHGKFCHFIMITSKSEPENIVEGLHAGAFDYLTKPINLPILKCKIEVIEKLLLREIELEVEGRYWNIHADQMEHLASERTKQLIHSDRMASIGVMSAGIAHEINNPTSFISGNIQTFERFWPEIERALSTTTRETAGDQSKIPFILEEVPGLISGIKNGVARISKIVKGLKTFSHQKESEKRTCQIGEILDHSLQFTTNILKKNVRVTTHIEPELPSIIADSQKIEQVLINLIVNAAHAMEKMSDAVLQISAARNHQELEIVVLDSGTGIPEEAMEKIWTPFFTTKEVGKGTGLGLHICRDIIQEHNGTITVSNNPSGGAKFTITLPLEKPDSRPSIARGAIAGEEQS